MLGRCLRVLAVSALYVAQLSCGGGRQSPSQSSVVSPRSSDETLGASASTPGVLPGSAGAPAAESDSPRETTVDEALADLDSMETPEGVDESLFSNLKSALAGQLRTLNAERGTSRIASSPPTCDANRVDDLALIDNGDGTYALTWSYRNVSDYNQDGIVNVLDITPLAAHFNEPTDETNESIDGSGDGAITILDVTPLAAWLPIPALMSTLSGRR